MWIYTQLILVEDNFLELPKTPNVNPTLLRLQICISVILCTGLRGIPFRIVSQASPCTNSVFRPSSRNSCQAWKWKTGLSKRPINYCTSWVKAVTLLCIVSNDAHTLSKPTKSSPLLANNPHILMLSVKWWRSISHSKDGRVKIALSSSVSTAIFFFCKSRKECWDLVKPIDRDD